MSCFLKAEADPKHTMACVSQMLKSIKLNLDQERRNADRLKQDIEASWSRLQKIEENGLAEDDIMKEVRIITIPEILKISRTGFVILDIFSRSTYSAPMKLQFVFKYDLTLQSATNTSASTSLIICV